MVNIFRPSIDSISVIKLSDYEKHPPVTHVLSRHDTYADMLNMTIVFEENLYII